MDALKFSSSEVFKSGKEEEKIINHLIRAAPVFKNVLKFLSGEDFEPIFGSGVQKYLFSVSTPESGRKFWQRHQNYGVKLRC